ncbi:MAG: four helix bundle protein [Phycisphaerae bacterium]|nr:four helix bundle protein [Phycisphaerae bacterium]
MSLASNFEDLTIWQDARQLLKEIYSIFMIKGLAQRDYGFRDQLQRAALSVMNNIAEGFERSSKADFARFLDIAKGSCGEVRSMLYVASDLGYIQKDKALGLISQFQILSKQIAALSKTLRKSNK